MSALDDLTWLAGCTGPDSKTPLIEGLRKTHSKCTAETGCFGWNGPGAGNISCAGRGWVPKQGAEAEVALLRWLATQVHEIHLVNILQDKAYPSRLFSVEATRIRGMIARGEAFAPKEEAHATTKSSEV